MSVSSEAALDGSVVSALLDVKAVYDLYEFRRIVEVEAAVRAAQRASGPDIEAIELSLGRFLHAYRERLPTWEQDVSFHKAVAGASHNVIYASVLDVLNERLLAVRRETQRSSAVLARAAQEHTAVFEAIRDRDADRAGKAMTSHIDSAMWALAEARRRLAPARVSTTVPRRGGSKRPAR
jgi:GntR family transcriptional repressor for pyruvate dehydrogenase complex